MLELGGGLYTDDDLATPTAEWVTPMTATRVRRRPVDDRPRTRRATSSRRGRAGGAARPAGRPRRRPLRALLIEAATAAGFDRPDVLSDTANGEDLLGSIAERIDQIDTEQAVATLGTGS